MDFLPDSQRLAALLAGLKHASAEPEARPSVAEELRRLEAEGLAASVALPQRNSWNASHWSSQASALSSSPVNDTQDGETDATSDSESSPLDGVLEGAQSLDARFAGFVAWLETELGARSVFLTDEEGLEMVQSGAGDGYLAAAGELGSVMRNLTNVLPGVSEGSTSLRLSENAGGASVELVWCSTNLGRYTVGLVLDSPIQGDWTSQIREALRKVVSASAG